jgi:hypothetical protein
MHLLPALRKPNYGRHRRHGIVVILVVKVSARFQMIPQLETHHGRLFTAFQARCFTCSGRSFVNRMRQYFDLEWARLDAKVG